MRLSISLLALAILLPAAAFAAPPRTVGADHQRTCPRTTEQVAEQPTIDGGRRLAPQKLTQLPGARAYMAVYRRIEGCEAPLTMVDYRGRGPR
jgi:hypothetical protein